MSGNKKKIRFFLFRVNLEFLTLTLSYCFEIKEWKEEIIRIKFSKVYLDFICFVVHSFVHPLHQALSGHAATALDKGILISGGFNCKFECLSTTYLYDPEKGSTQLAEMAKDRALHCMELLRGRLYVAGGVCNLRKFYTDQQTCEVYDPAADSWAAFTSLCVPHVGAASAVLEDKIYILGGYCQEDYSETGLVHRFDPSLHRWEQMGKLPAAVTDLRACLLQLPQHLRF